jgi:DNA-binding NarL/FixJ family response regulator
MVPHVATGDPAPMADPAIRALLVDDNAEFLKSTADFLFGRPDLELIGWTTSAAEALDIVRSGEVDLVLMDLVMPGMSGLEATRRIKERAAPTKVVMLTLHDGPEYRDAAAAAGADGFVPKSEMGSRLIPVLDSLFGKGRGVS